MPLNLMGIVNEGNSMFRKLAATIAVTSALVSTQVKALGLGELDADSGLNQPLKAEIHLLSSKSFDEADLKARIASFESYSKFGVTRESGHSDIRFQVYTKKDGSKAIRVSTTEPIKEPFLNFLVELNWPQGKLLREYTVLLDPPVFNKTAATTHNTTDTAPLTRNQTPSERRRTSTETQTTRTSTPSFEGNTWTVGRGETLWKIAKAVKPNGVTVQQTLAALYRNNPQAFINNDMNRLKAGAVLGVPGSEQIEDISHRAALSDIRSSTPRTDAPLDVRKTIDESASSRSNNQGGRLSLASVDQSSSSQSSGSSTDENDTEVMQSEIDSLREAVETLKLQNDQLKEQLAESADTSKTGVAVEDDTLAVLSGAAEVNTESLESVIDDSSSIDDTSLENSLETPQDAIVEESDSETANSTIDNSQNLDSSEAITEQPVVQQPVVQQPKAITPVKKEKAFYEADNFWLWLGGGVLGLLALIVGFIFYRNRQVDEHDGGLLGSMGANTHSGERRDSFLVDEKMSAPEEESDPIGEADILIARGNLEKAEVLLSDALNQDPANDEVRVKLMEVYASQQNLDEFKLLKRGLPQDFDHDSELGLKVASLTGLLSSLEPESSHSTESISEFELPSEEDIFGSDEERNIDVNIDLSEELETSDDEIDDFSASLDLDLDMNEVQEANEPVKETEPEPELDLNAPLEFDLDMGLESSSKETVSSSQSQVDDSNSLEFSLDMDDEPLVSEDTSAAVLDMQEEFKDGDGLSDDEAATKLDLARAYIEMGDEEAAKDILLELQKEGNQKQSEEASKLLADL